jgi:hypothetical protein
MRFTTVIGNPPYGTGAHLAIKFLNKSAELTDEVRFVIPMSFNKDSVRNKIDQELHLTHNVDLPDDTFPRSIRTVYQIWTRQEEQRELIPVYTTHPDLEFLKYEDRDKADVFVGSAGAGPAGKVKTENFTHYAKGHHLIRCSEEVKQRLLDIAPQLRYHSRICGCLPGLCKSDLIKIYMNNYGKEQA